ncbi:MAG: DUF2911 domain-containing protein [Saprospiraceae bacterium]|uniref:DUF2911 domain-containing protein n=1 Tax=Candidatus Defluviibacterium haderslevense TaxID=2981993 RepID=A0A9D7SBA6_9BACT|nr:DUF2911 domain-containing protein [Candidatus Defluviibacterium haderslevense]
MKMYMGRQFLISGIMALSGIFYVFYSNAQMLKMPNDGTNYKCSTGRTIGLTDIDIKWNSPGVKGRDGKIWGELVYYGFSTLGYGSNMESPWRAGADESTTISFSTEVTINGKSLAAGKYGFFIAVYPDSCVLIFNKNTSGWGSYFYNKDLDVLRVATRQFKDIKDSKERLEYIFENQTENSVEIALLWEHWRIPMKVEVDLTKTTLASIRTQLSSGMGFDPPSLEAGANWCLNHNINFDEALNWINSATNPNLGGVRTFKALSTHAGLLGKTGKQAEADKMMTEAIEIGGAIDLHQYGRSLLNQKKYQEAMIVFEKNFKKHAGAWPTNVGMMRGYSALGNLKKALEHGKVALTQAPTPEDKKNMEGLIKTLEGGKAL